MQWNLKSAGTMLRRFKNLLFGKSEKQADACAYAEASRKSGSSSNQTKEKPMIKVGEKVLVIARITQVVEDEDGVHYVVSPDDKKRSFFTLRIRKEDIQSCVPND